MEVLYVRMRAFLSTVCTINVRQRRVPILLPSLSVSSSLSQCDSLSLARSPAPSAMRLCDGKINIFSNILLFFVFHIVLRPPSSSATINALDDCSRFPAEV